MRMSQRNEGPQHATAVRSRMNFPRVSAFWKPAEESTRLMKRQSGTFQMLVRLGAEIPWEIAMGLGWGMTLSHVSEFGMPLGTLMSSASPSHPTLGTCCFSVPCSPHSRPPRVLQVLPPDPRAWRQLGDIFQDKHTGCVSTRLLRADPPPRGHLVGGTGVARPEASVSVEKPLRPRLQQGTALSPSREGMGKAETCVVLGDGRVGQGKPPVCLVACEGKASRQYFLNE